MPEASGSACNLLVTLAGLLLSFFGRAAQVPVGSCWPTLPEHDHQGTRYHCGGPSTGIWTHPSAAPQRDCLNAEACVNPQHSLSFNWLWDEWLDFRISFSLRLTSIHDSPSGIVGLVSVGWAVTIAASNRNAYFLDVPNDLKDGQEHDIEIWVAKERCQIFIDGTLVKSLPGSSSSKSERRRCGGLSFFPRGIVIGGHVPSGGHAVFSRTSGQVRNFVLYADISNEWRLSDTKPRVTSLSPDELAAWTRIQGGWQGTLSSTAVPCSTGSHTHSGHSLMCCPGESNIFNAMLRFFQADKTTWMGMTNTPIGKPFHNGTGYEFLVDLEERASPVLFKQVGQNAFQLKMYQNHYSVISTVGGVTHSVMVPPTCMYMSLEDLPGGSLKMTLSSEFWAGLVPLYGTNVFTAMAIYECPQTTHPPALQLCPAVNGYFSPELYYHPAEKTSPRLDVMLNVVKNQVTQSSPMPLQLQNSTSMATTTTAQPVVLAKRTDEEEEGEEDDSRTNLILGGSAAGVMLLVCICSLTLHRRCKRMARHNNVKSSQEVEPPDVNESSSTSTTNRRKQNDNSSPNPNQISGSEGGSNGVSSDFTFNVFRALQATEIAACCNMEHRFIRHSDVVCTQRIGNGSFGTVWRGKLHGITEVAVKIPHEDKKQSASKLEAIANELRIFRRIRHPDIVLFYGCMQENERLCLILEWVTGCDFKDFIRKRRTNKQWANDLSRGAGIGRVNQLHEHALLTDVARGMHYLHAQDPLILHRDLKPANILVEQMREPPHGMIADFGLSFLIEHQNPHSRAGTRAYMAPEVFQFQPYSAAADIFSFGCIGFFVITAENPDPATVYSALQAGWPGMDNEALANILLVSQQCVHTESHRRLTAASVFAGIQCKPGEVWNVKRHGDVVESEPASTQRMTPVDTNSPSEVSPQQARSGDQGPSPSGSDGGIEVRSNINGAPPAARAPDVSAFSQTPPNLEEQPAISEHAEAVMVPGLPTRPQEKAAKPGLGLIASLTAFASFGHRSPGGPIEAMSI